MKTAIKYIVITVVFLAAGGTVAYLVMRPRPGNGNSNREEVPVNVVVSVVEPVTLPDAVILPASVEAFKSVTVAAEVQGKVEWVGVEEGAKVTEGTPIAKIDIRTIEADLDSAGANYDLQLSNYNRLETLHRQGTITDAVFEQQKAQLDVSKALLETVRIRLEKAVTTAPVSGILNHRYVEAGEFVSPGDPIADIVQTEKVKVVIDVPERDVRYVKVGRVMAILTDKPPGDDPSGASVPEAFVSAAAGLIPADKKLAVGTVSYQSVVADLQTRTYRVEVTVPNPDRSILPGMIVRAVLLRRIINGCVAVPLRAVVPLEGRYVVFVERDGRAVEVEVALGITDGRNIQVTSGLSIGDRLLVEGQRQVSDGQAVAVRESGI
ncbi:MAG: efflux RND transporter periplasmic adaptor subunit [Planctomycetes bacterium]|nr:efflux RND transporter periplasmic adaptor subunit [Planctomycetota bacterium]